MEQKICEKRIMHYKMYVTKIILSTINTGILYILQIKDMFQYPSRMYVINFKYLKQRKFNF